MKTKIEKEISHPVSVDMTKLKTGDSMKVQICGLQSGETNLIITKTKFGNFSIVREYWYEKGKR